MLVDNMKNQRGRRIDSLYSALHIERLPNYLKVFGPLSGMFKFCRVHVPPPNGEVFAVPLGRRRIFLRRSASDTSIFFQIFVKREYDTAQWPHHANLDQQYRAIIREGRTPIIVDAGANIGLAALWFAERYPAAKIYAIEPDEANFKILLQNIGSNSRIVGLQGAVWDRPGQLTIINPQAGAGAFRVAEGEGPVRGFSIPEVVAMEELGTVFIVKIDIEGGEAALFRSNTEWVGDAAMITVELHDWLYPWEHTSQSFLSAVSSFPMDFLVRGENVFCFRSR
jgi:FkbM family methyltransferase